MKTFEPQERDRIRGIVFFGPPHFGFNLNSWEKFSSKIGQCVGQSGVGLPYDEFGRLNLQFGNWLNRLEYAFDIVCFYENRPTYRTGLASLPFFYAPFSRLR